LVRRRKITRNEHINISVSHDNICCIANSSRNLNRVGLLYLRVHCRSVFRYVCLSHFVDWNGQVRFSTIIIDRSFGDARSCVMTTQVIIITEVLLASECRRSVLSWWSARVN